MIADDPDLIPFDLDVDQIVAEGVADILAGLDRRLAFEAWADEREGKP